MSTLRIYRGALGEIIRVPEHTFAKLPKLHFEAQRFPFAELAERMGAKRDHFARAVNWAGLFQEAMDRKDVRAMLAD